MSHDADSDSLHIYLDAFNMNDSLILEPYDLFGRDVFAFAEQNLSFGVYSSEFLNFLLQILEWLFRR